MVCTYWQTSALRLACKLYLHSVPPALSPCTWVLCFWEQPALNNVILCQQTLQVMYVLQTSRELWVGWNKDRMWILWCPFDGIFITYLWHPIESPRKLPGRKSPCICFWVVMCVSTHVYACKKGQRNRESKAVGGAGDDIWWKSKG